MQLAPQEQTELDKQINAALKEWAEHYQPTIVKGAAASQREVGEALKAIRDKHLYREQASNFYVYCARKWGMVPDRVNHYIQIAENVQPQPPSQLPDSKQEFIYFLAYVDVVKIGFTNSLNSRISSIRMMSPVPLALLGAIPGDRHKEQEIHQRFAHLRRHGEWFSLTDDLKRYLDRILADAK